MAHNGQYLKIFLSASITISTTTLNSPKYYDSYKTLLSFFLKLFNKYKLELPFLYIKLSSWSCDIIRRSKTPLFNFKIVLNKKGIKPNPNKFKIEWKTFLSHRKEPKIVNSEVICKANKLTGVTMLCEVRANLTGTWHHEFLFGVCSIKN